MTLDMYAACVAFSYNGGNKGFATSETASLINQKIFKVEYWNSTISFYWLITNLFDELNHIISN